MFYLCKKSFSKQKLKSLFVVIGIQYTSCIVKLEVRCQQSINSIDQYLPELCISRLVQLVTYPNNCGPTFSLLFYNKWEVNFFNS